VVDDVADPVVDLEEEKDLLGQRMHSAREIDRRDLELDARARRRQAGAKPVPLVELAHPLHQEGARRSEDLRRYGGAVRCEAEAAVAPREQAEERLLALHASRAGLDQVAVAHPHGSPLLASTRIAAGDLDRPGPAVHVEELEQIGERDLGQSSFELAIGLRVAPRRVDSCALGEERLDANGDLFGVGRRRQDLVEVALLAIRGRHPTEEEEAHGLRPRVRPEDLGQLSRIDESEVEGRDDDVRNVRQCGLERTRTVGSVGRGEAPRAAGLGDLAGPAAVAVRDEHCSAHAPAPLTRPPGCRDPGRAGMRDAPPGPAPRSDRARCRRRRLRRE